MTQIVTIVRGYITSMWVAVYDELPCQSKQANSKDPFAVAVAVTAGKLIADLKKFPTILVDSVDPQLDDNEFGFLNSSSV